MWDDDCPSGTHCYGASCDAADLAVGKCLAPPPPPPPDLLVTYDCWDTRDCPRGVCAMAEVFACGNGSDDVLGFCTELR